MHVKPEQVNQLFTAAPQQTSIIRILCQRHTIISKTNYVAARLASGVALMCRKRFSEGNNVRGQQA
jgi:hypothetical protein